MTDIKQMLASNLNDLGEIHLSAKDSAVLLTIVYDLICVDSLYERIKLLEKRVIDLQGHDDLSYIDKKLSEQERVERLRAEKKQIYEDIKDAVEAKLKESNGGE